MSDYKNSETRKICITCLVDNTSEFSTSCWAEHGVSFLIETENTKVLFDTGQSGDVLVHNLSVLEKDLKDLTCVVLSHGHYDHTGGLEAVLAMCPGIEIIAHPDLFSERFSRQTHKLDRAVGIPFTREELKAKCHFRLTSESLEIDSQIITSGQIPRSHGPEPRNFKELVCKNGRLEPDPFLDDQCLFIKTDRGLVVLLGCCHAGLVNTLEQVQRISEDPVFAILGGTHLGKVDEATVQECVAMFSRRHDVQQIYAGHCTGTRGLIALSRALGDRVKPCSAGIVSDFLCSE